MTTVWDRIQPLTEAENEKLEVLLRLAAAKVLKRDELVKMERLLYRRDRTNGKTRH